MKKCRRCTMPASLHITEIKEGEVRALHLCEKCAQEYLQSVDTGGDGDDDASFPSIPALTQSEEEDDEPNLVCPNCHISYKQFRSEGRLGCPHDYEVFREKLIPLLESIHNETQHVGKCPQHCPEISKRQHELVLMKTKLREAVEKENYEQAATLRDAIRLLENGEEEE